MMKPTFFILLLTWCVLFAHADELSDAIRQAENAKSEANRLSQSADESRRKAKELYNETRVNTFNFAADRFSSASFQFDRAVKDKNSARYSLNQLQKYGTPSHATDAEKYNKALDLMNQGNERFNRGIDEYNKKLTRERRDAAAENWRDAYDLEQRIGEAITAISGKAGAGNITSCLKTARDRVGSALIYFNTAKGSAANPDKYGEQMKWGISNFNQAIDLFNKKVKEGTCK